MINQPSSPYHIDISTTFHNYQSIQEKWRKDSIFILSHSSLSFFGSINSPPIIFNFSSNDQSSIIHYKIYESISCLVLYLNKDLLLNQQNNSNLSSISEKNDQSNKNNNENEFLPICFQLSNISIFKFSLSYFWNKIQLISCIQNIHQNNNDVVENDQKNDQFEEEMEEPTSYDLQSQIHSKNQFILSNLYPGLKKMRDWKRWLIILSSFYIISPSHSPSSISFYHLIYHFQSSLISLSLNK